MVLFTAGALPILMGIVWTNDYASDSAHVVAPFAVGFPILVAFCLWERYAPLKHPLTPTYVFSASHGRDLTAPCIALAVVNMAYYGSSLLWPTMINEFYTNFNTNWRYGVLLSAVQGMTVGIGAIGLTTLGSKIQHWQWQLTVATMVMVLFGTLFSVLGKPDNKGMTIALFGLSQVGYGWAIYLSMAICQMGVNHEDLGISGGIAGTARFAGGSSKVLVISQNLQLILFSCDCCLHNHTHKYSKQMDGKTCFRCCYQSRLTCIGSPRPYEGNRDRGPAGVRKDIR